MLIIFLLKDLYMPYNKNGKKINEKIMKLDKNNKLKLFQ